MEQNRGITDDDVMRMTDSKDKDTKGESEEEKALMAEWEQHMHDFFPEDISTIVIEPRKETVSSNIKSFEIDFLRRCWRRSYLH